MAQREIRYTEVGERSRESGTSFHHAGHIQGPVAYIVGFGWTRAPAGAVKVELIKPQGRPAGEDPAVWAKIVDEVKAAVRFHVEHKGNTKVKSATISIREHME